MISIIGILERPLELNPTAFYIRRVSLFTYLRGVASTWGLLIFDEKAPPGAAWPWQRRLASRDASLLDSTVGSLSESE
jgi:hypothetical protein